MHILGFPLFYFSVSSLLLVVSGGDIKSIAHLRVIRSPDEVMCLQHTMSNRRNARETSGVCRVDTNITGPTSAKHSHLDVSQAEEIYTSGISKDIRLLRWKIFARDVGGRRETPVEMTL